MTPLVSYKAAIAENILPFLSKPSRYIAAEWNAVVKDPATAEVRIALAFPDVYEIGMSHLGLKILYQILNARPEILAERVYAPWLDAEALLREQQVPLCSQESGLPLSGFDIVGFTLQYELSFATILAMLELGGIPVRSGDRRDGDPLVVAGGPVAFAPEPLADFVDAFLIGDGEEAALELCAVVRDWKRQRGGREALLRAVKGIPGMYVPALHRPGRGGARNALLSGSIRSTMGDFPYRTWRSSTIARGSRSCGAVRRDAASARPGIFTGRCANCDAPTIRAMVERSLQGTGYEEISLSSLSIADLACLRDLFPALMERLAPTRTSLSLPSLAGGGPESEPGTGRRDRPRAQDGVHHRPGGGLGTPAGTSSTRSDSTKRAFLLPSRMPPGRLAVAQILLHDRPAHRDAGRLDDIVRVAREAARIARRERSPRFRPHGQRQLLRTQAAYAVPVVRAGADGGPAGEAGVSPGRLRESRIDFKWQHVESSFLEAVFARGTREVGAAIALAHQRGCRFDGWTEQLKFETWMRAFADAGVDAYAIANRPVSAGGVAPVGSHRRRRRQGVPAARVPPGPGRTSDRGLSRGPVQRLRRAMRADWQAWARDDRVLVSPTPERVEASTGGTPSRRRPSAPSVHATAEDSISNFRRWGSFGSCPTSN